MLKCWSVEDLSSFSVSCKTVSVGHDRLLFHERFASHPHTLSLWDPSVWSSKWLFSNKFSYQNFIFIFYFLCPSYMSGLLLLPLYDCLTNKNLGMSFTYLFLCKICHSILTLTVWVFGLLQHCGWGVHSSGTFGPYKMRMLHFEMLGTRCPVVQQKKNDYFFYFASCCPDYFVSCCPQNLPFMHWWCMFIL